MWDLIIPVASDRGFGRSNLNTDKKKKKKRKKERRRRRRKLRNIRAQKLRIFLFVMVI